MQPLNTINETTSSGWSSAAFSPQPWIENPHPTQPRDDRVENSGAASFPDTPWFSCSPSAPALNDRCHDKPEKIIPEIRSKTKERNINACQAVSDVSTGTGFPENVCPTSGDAPSQAYNATAPELTQESEKNVCSKMAKWKTADTNSKKVDHLHKPSGLPKRSELDDHGSSSPSRKTTKGSWKNSTLPCGSNGKEHYLDLPVEEYDKVESCESKGLKLTFRRKSTERLQPSQTPPTQPKEPKRKQPQGIPKLVVLKCKCPEGYSKKELQCTVCQSELRNKDLADGNNTVTSIRGDIKDIVLKVESDKGHSDIKSQSKDMKASVVMPNASKQDPINTGHDVGADSSKEVAPSKRRRRKSETSEDTSDRCRDTMTPPSTTRSDTKSSSVAPLPKCDTRTIPMLPSLGGQSDIRSPSSSSKCDDTVSMQPMSKCDSKSMLTLSKSDTKPRPLLSKSDTKSILPKSDTKPPAPKGDTKPPAPKGDSKPPTPKGDAKPPAPKGDTKPPAPKGDTKPPTPKSDTKPPAPKGDTKPPAPKGDSKPPTPKGDAKPPTPKSDTKPPAPKGDTKPPTPKSDTKPPAAKGDTKPPAAKGDTKPPAAKGDTKPPTPKGDAKPPTPKSDTKPPAPKGDTKPTTPKGDAKPPTPKSDTKPPTPKSDTKPPAPKGDTKPPAPKGDTKPPTPKSHTNPPLHKIDTKPLSPSPKSDTKSLSQSPKSDTKSLSQSPKSDTRPMSPSHKNDTKLLSQSPKSDTKSLSQSPKSDTRPMSPSPKNDTKSLSQSPKSETKPLSLSPKGDTKSLPPSLKSDTKPLSPSTKSDTKLPLPQKDTRLMAPSPKSDTKPPLLKSDTKSLPPLLKSDTKSLPLLCKSDTKPRPHSSKSDIKPMSPSPKSDTKPPLLKCDSKSMSTSPKSDTKPMPLLCKSDTKPRPHSSKSDSKSPSALSKRDTNSMSDLVKSNSVEIGTVFISPSSQGNYRSISEHELLEKQETKPELLYQNSAEIHSTVHENIINQNCALPEKESANQGSCIAVKTIVQPTRSITSDHNAMGVPGDEPSGTLAHTPTSGLSLGAGWKSIDSLGGGVESVDIFESVSKFKRTPYRRSSSAPPPSTTYTLTLAPTVASSECRSSPLDLSHISQTLIDHAARIKQTLLDRPKSSPPLSCFYYQTQDPGSKKQPVVILDRLPSPVIELYSIQNLNGAQLPNQHLSARSCSSIDTAGERASDSEWSSSDFETRRKSSGKLKFTYTKVAHKRKYQIKTKRKSKKHPSGENMGSEGPVSEQTYPPTRRQYLRASKQGVRYVNEDDILDEIMAASLLEDQLSSHSDLLNGSKENSCKGQKKPGRKRKLIPQEITSNTPDQVCETAEKDTRYLDVKAKGGGDGTDAFVDPKIKAMSAALIRAYEGNQNGEKIAFGKSPKGRRLGRPKNGEKNTTERKLGTKIRSQLTRKKMSFRRQQRAMPNVYVGFDSFPKRIGEDKYRPSSIASDVPAFKASGSGTECRRRPSDVSSQTGKICPSGKYRNLFESDVFNTRLAGDVLCKQGMPQQLRKTQHIVSHECRKAHLHVQEYIKTRYLHAREHRKQKQFIYPKDFGKTQHPFPQEQIKTQLHQPNCRKCGHLEADVKGDASESCGYLSSRLAKCHADRDAESECCRSCRCRLRLCNVKQHAADDSPDAVPEERSDTQSCPADDDRSCSNEIYFDPDVVVKTEVGGPEVSPEDYAMNDYTLFPASRALDNRTFDSRNLDSRDLDSRALDSCALESRNLAIDRDVDFMSLDYSKSEYAKDEEFKARPGENYAQSGNCDSALRCFDIWKMRALNGQSPYSYYLEVPVGQGSFNHASVHGDIMEQNTCAHSKPGQTKFIKSTDITSQTHACKNQKTATKSLPTPDHNPSCLNKPLSIHICPSPDMSDYGSPPFLTECPPSWCPTKGALLKHDDTHNLCCAGDTCLRSHKGTGGCHFSDVQKQGKTLPKLSIPKITVSSPSSTNTQSNETPSSVSPSCVAYPSFLSPGLPHARRIQRCVSPFRQPYYLASPSKQARDDLFKNNRDTSPSLDDKSHRHLKLLSPRTGRCCLTKVTRRNVRPHTDMLVDSDDSDSTLVYPTADKRGQWCGRQTISRRSSMGLSSVGLSEGSPISALSSPCMKGEDRAMSPDSQTIERRQTELSTMVSDLRESISKSKAMKRSRRTNSFSGDTHSKMPEPEMGSQRRTPKPLFERFMSVEAMMDSDTPYATITKRMSAGSKCEDMEMMTYVSGFCLQRKQEEANSTSESLAETQMYGMDYTLSDTQNREVADNGRLPGFQEPVRIKTEPMAASPETCLIESPVEAPDPATDDSDSEERPLVVIENAESNEVIEGDEAYKKVTSGTYRLPTGPGKSLRGRGVTRRRRRKASGFLSVRTLFSRKATVKIQRAVRGGLLDRTKKIDATRDKTTKKIRNSAPAQPDAAGLSRGTPEIATKRKPYKPRKTAKESGELADNCTLKRRRKHSEGAVPGLSKSETSELLAEQINQSSAARILQELPRYNWLEQKILQKNSYVPVSGAVGLGSPQVQDRGGGGSSTSRSATAGPAHPKSSAKPGPKFAGEDVHETSSCKGQKNASQGQATGYTLPGEDSKSVHSGDTATELTLFTFSNKRNMATLSEKPSPVTCDVLLTKADVNCVPPDLDYDMCPTSPESGLTIDLSHVDDTGRDARSPGGEVDEDLANTSSTAVQVKRTTDDISSPASNDLKEPIKVTPSSLPLSQLDLSTRSSDDHEVSGDSVIKSENVETEPTDDSAASPVKPTESPDVGLTKPSMNGPEAVTLVAQPPVTDMSLVGALSLQAPSLSATPEAHETPSPAGFDGAKGSSAQTATATGSGCGGNQQSRFSSGVRASAAATTTTTNSNYVVISSVNTTTITHSTETVPLDLCLKKSESLTTTNSRAKGHPPVQMVLPQIQHKAIASPHMTPLPTSPVAAVGKSLVSPVQLTQELDPKQSEISGNDILTSKQRSSLGPEFKVETTYPLHVDTLDLCMKTPNALKSLSGDQDASSHLNECTVDGPAIDERITIGLALSAELETEADRASKTKSLDMEASLRTLAQANVADVGTSLKPELLDIPISLSSSYQDISKTMTDAELDQEFQKHLIEFKALEKLAERKAQEQMQVAIMRKRKAAMLRIMEMKKAKRDFDRVGLLSNICPESDKATASMLKNSPVNSSNTPFSPSSNTSTTGVATNLSSSALLSPGSAQGAGVSSPSTLLDCTAKPAPLRQLFQTGAPGDVQEKQTDMDVTNALPQMDEPPTVSKIKTEMMVCDIESNLTPLKLECKNEFMEISCSDQKEMESQSQPMEIVSSESKSVLENMSGKETVTERESRVEQEDCGDKDEPGTKRSQNLLTPSPAHQTQPQLVHLDIQESPAATAYSLGPYNRRSVQINEPPFISKDTQKEDQPQKAHSQRPFQTAGNLIVLNSGTLPTNGSPNSVKALLKQESSQAVKSNVFKHSKLIAQSSNKSSNRPPSQSDVINTSRSAERSDVVGFRGQRKSLDDSEIRTQNRSITKAVLDSGPKSADQVTKSYQPFHQGHSVSDKRLIARTSEADAHHQQQVLSRPMMPQFIARPNERPLILVDDAGDKKSAFKAHVKPQNNLVIDLTRDSRSSSSDLSLAQQGGPHLSSPMDDRLHFSKQDSCARRSHGSLPGTGSRGNPSTEEIPSTLYPEFHAGHEKPSSLPNGFNTDRSRPGGFLTNQHRLPVRLERPIPVKDPVYMREQMRPTMSTVAQHRQRYLDPAHEHHLNISGQSAGNKTYHKGSEELSPSYAAGSHLMPSASSWVEDQHHEFPSAHAPPHWRGHSPIATSRHMEMYGDVDMANRMLADDMDKQRNRLDIHSAFQKHTDLAYKQKHFDAGGISRPAINPGAQHPLTHPSLHAVSLHQQSMVLHSLQSRPPHPDPQTSFSDSYMRQQQQQQQQGQLQQQQKSRALPPMEGTQASWRTYGTVDCTLTPSSLQQRTAYVGNQSLNSSIQDPLAYQKLHQQQMMQHQQHQHYQFQQLQVRPTHKISQNPSPTGQRMPLPPSHPSQSVAIPQLMFSDSPSSQSSGVILPQNPGLHHRSSESEHLNMMRQRQFPHPIFDQRSRQPVPQSLAPPPAQATSILQPKGSPMTQMSAAPRANYPSVGQALSHPPSVTSSQAMGHSPSVTSSQSMGHPPSVTSSQSMGHPPSITNSLCRVCGNVAVYLCSSCRRVWYCNPHCQTKDWGVHATECKPAT